MARIRLGDLLLQAGLIDEMQLQSAVARQRQWGGKLGDILVNNGFIDEMMLWRGLSKLLSVPLVCLPDLTLSPGIEKQLGYDLCVKNSMFPILRDDKGLTVATSDPSNIAALDDVAFRLGLRLRAVLAPDREIDWAIRRYHQGDNAPCPAPRLKRQSEEFPMAAQSPRAAAGQGFAPGASAAPRSESAQPEGGPPHAQPPPVGTSSSPATARTESERMMRETAQLMRLLVESCMRRGIFTHEEYLKKIKTLS